MLVILLIGGAGWMIFQKTVHNRLRDTIQSEFDKKLANSTLHADLGNAQFLEGQGIRIRDLNLVLPSENSDSQSACSIEIDEAFLHAPVSMAKLVSCETKPEAFQIRRAKISLCQNAAGDWNLPALWRELQNLSNPTCGPVPTSLSDCVIELENANHEQAIRLTDVALEILPVQHQGQSLLQVRGQLNSHEVSQAEFLAFVNLEQRTWYVQQFSVEKIRLSKNWQNLFPESIRRSFTRVSSLSGQLQINGTANGDLDFNTEPQFQITGRLRDLLCESSYLPLPIRNLNLDFSVNNDQLALARINGRVGDSQIKLDYRQIGLIDRKQWTLEGRVDNFDFANHSKLASLVPKYYTDLCDEYSPSGPANIQFRLHHDGQRLKRDVRGQLTDMSFSWHKFPYRVDHCTGDVTLTNDICEFEIRNATGDKEMKMTGSVHTPGPNATYKIKLDVPGDVPVDEKLLRALDAFPELADVVRDMNPVGRVGGQGWIVKPIAGGEISKSFDIQLKQCHVRHRHFEYPIHNINGMVKTQNLDFQFVDLRGNNNSGQIQCNGTWNPDNGLQLIFNCQSVPLDNQLRFALSSDLQEIWRGFRPRGTVDQMRVNLDLPIGESMCDVSVDATMTKPVAGAEPNVVSIHPLWFPYEIKNLTGNVKIGDGEIKLTQMEGHHDRTWVVCQGDGHYADDSWSVKLHNLLVTSLKVDEDLLTAVPTELAPPLRQLDFQGLLNVHGEVTLAGQQVLPKKFSPPLSATGPPQLSIHRQQEQASATMRNTLAWDLRFDLNNSSMTIGLPIENVFGKVELIGHYDGSQAVCEGELDVDSLTIYDAQITNVSGPIWMDNHHSAAGLLARTLKKSKTEQKNFSPIKPAANENRSLTGKMHGGIVRFDAQISSTAPGEFYLQTTLADGNLKQFCREFAPHLTDISGRSFASLRLTGDCQSTRSYRGDGTMRLREAKIYELPVMLSLLKMLKVGKPDRTAFDSSNADFTVHGEDINFSRIEMLGDAISLVGNGTMNLDRDIDLNFYSIMGRNRIKIPVISDLYHASSQRILWINVDGSLDDPQTHRHVLPQVNGSLRQLFQPPERRMATEHNQLRLR